MSHILDPDFEDEEVFLSEDQARMFEGSDDFEFDDSDFDWEPDDWALELSIPTMNCGSYVEE